MKVTQTPDDQLPLMCGVGTRFGARSRPTMISAKYRLKEERRKVLKISIGKLKKIEDPESSLRRSVLINNTVKRLQKEAREEKLLKQQVLYTSASSCFLDDPEPAATQTPPPTMTAVSAGSDPLAPTPTPSAVACVTPPPNTTADATAPLSDGTNRSRKRPLLEDDCSDVLSQFYMPPTPRMLTSIDDDEDDVVVDVVQLDPASPSGDHDLPKRPKFEVAVEVPDPATAELERRLFSCGGDDLRNSTCCWSAGGSSASDDLRLRFSDSSRASSDSSQMEQQPQQYSCGHASIFGEIQSVVFHSLIASLES